MSGNFEFSQDGCAHLDFYPHGPGQMNSAGRSFPPPPTNPPYFPPANGQDGQWGGHGPAQQYGGDAMHRGAQPNLQGMLGALPPGSCGMQGGQARGVQGPQGMHGIHGMQGARDAQNCVMQGGQVQGMQNPQGMQGIHGMQSARGAQTGQGFAGFAGGPAMQDLQFPQGWKGQQFHGTYPGLSDSATQPQGGQNMFAMQSMSGTQGPQAGQSVGNGQVAPSPQSTNMQGQMMQVIAVPVGVPPPAFAIPAGVVCPPGAQAVQWGQSVNQDTLGHQGQGCPPGGPAAQWGQSMSQETQGHRGQGAIAQQVDPLNSIQNQMLQVIALPAGTQPPEGAIPMPAELLQSPLQGPQVETPEKQKAPEFMKPSRASRFRIVDPKTGKEVRVPGMPGSPEKRALRIVNPKTGEEVHAPSSHGCVSVH